MYKWFHIVGWDARELGYVLIGQFIGHRRFLPFSKIEIPDGDFKCTKTFETLTPPVIPQS